jgi:hypothetical protein
MARAPARSAPAAAKTSWVTKEIRDGLGVLDRYAKLSLEKFLDRTAAVDAAKYRLLIALEAAVSMCHHLAMRLAGGPRRAVQIASRRSPRGGIIPTDLPAGSDGALQEPCSSVSRNEWCTVGRHDCPI